MRARSGRLGFPLAIVLGLSLSPACLLTPVFAETDDNMSATDGPRSLVGNYLAGRMARDQNETSEAAAFF